MRSTGAIDFVMNRLMGNPNGVRSAISRIFLPVFTVSAFLNNTPVVAMMIPGVLDWAKRLKISPSKLMIPLSYSAILGGTCTLIGTSTNLLVFGLALNAGLSEIGFFEIGKIGIPVGIIGGLFLVMLGPVFLPDRSSAADSFQDLREFICEMKIAGESVFDGQTVAESGLAALGCYLIEIERQGDSIPVVGPHHMLRSGDILVFAGDVDSIKELQKLRGLLPATEQVFKLDEPRHRRLLCEAVLAGSSPLVGMTVKESKFRTKHNAAVLAIARNARRVRGKLGDIVLQAGDILLLEATPMFEVRQRASKDFLLIKTLEGSTPRNYSKSPIALFILASMVLLATFELLSMLQASLLAAGALLISRCCTVSEARDSIDWSVLVVIAAALGFGTALQVSGAAATIAGSVVALAGSSPFLSLVAIYLTTSLMTEIVTNNAAVALIFPVALATSTQLGVQPEPFIFAIMMAGSASFATPLGYQTNLMVYGPGGYKFSDFLRFGIIMNILIAACTLTLIPFIWSF
jgi:di/tricarboxylate transporter